MRADAGQFGVTALADAAFYSQEAPRKIAPSQRIQVSFLLKDRTPNLFAVSHRIFINGRRPFFRDAAQTNL